MIIGKNNRMAYTKKAESSSDIAKIIELINLMPLPDFYLERRNSSSVPRMAFGKHIDKNHFASVIEIRRETKDGVEIVKKSECCIEFLRNLFRKFDERIIQYLFEISGLPTFDHCLDVLSRYEDLARCQRFIEVVIEFNRISGMFRERNQKINVYSETELIEKAWLWTGVDRPEFDFIVPLSANDDGLIRLNISPFLQKLLESDTTRIKRCGICEKIFWAKKTNAETCGQKNCASTLYNRKRLAKIKVENKAKKEVREKWKNEDFSKKGRK